MAKTVPDISPLMPMHQDPLLVLKVIATSIFPRFRLRALKYFVKWAFGARLWQRLWRWNTISINTSSHIKCLLRGMESETKQWLEVLGDTGNWYLPWQCYITFHILFFIIHQSPVDSPHKWPVVHGLMFYLFLASTSCWTNNQVASD